MADINGISFKEGDVCVVSIPLESSTPQDLLKWVLYESKLVIVDHWFYEQGDPRCEVSCIVGQLNGWQQMMYFKERELEIIGDIR